MPNDRTPLSAEEIATLRALADRSLRAGNGIHGIHTQIGGVLLKRICAAVELAAAKDAEIDRLEHRISELTDADLPDSDRRGFESQAEVLIRESERQTGEITALRQRAEKAEADARQHRKMRREFGAIISNHCIAMQAAVIDGHLRSPAHGLQWISNTLFGPGLLPDPEEAKVLGGAQAWFDAKTAEEESRQAAIASQPATDAGTGETT